MKSKFITYFVLFTTFLFLTTALIVFFFDPFFHYHKPLGNLKAVATDTRHQVIGSVRPIVSV